MTAPDPDDVALIARVRRRIDCLPHAATPQRHWSPAHERADVRWAEQFLAGVRVAGRSLTDIKEG